MLGNQNGGVDTPSGDLRDGPDLLLRRWRLDDAPAVHELVAGSIEHLAPWLPWAAGGYSEQQAVEFLEDASAKWDSREAFHYALVLPGQGAVGSASLMDRIGGDGLEIGYWLARPHWGRGYITRAVRALVREAFRAGADRVEILHDSANVRSGAVPRRLGFTEVERRPAPRPWMSGQAGTHVVWRLRSA